MPATTFASGYRKIISKDCCHIGCTCSKVVSPPTEGTRSECGMGFVSPSNSITIAAAVAAEVEAGTSLRLNPPAVKYAPPREQRNRDDSHTIDPKLFAESHCPTGIGYSVEPDINIPVCPIDENANSSFDNTKLSTPSGLFSKNGSHFNSSEASGSEPLTFVQTPSSLEHANVGVCRKVGSTFDTQTPISFVPFQFHSTISNSESKGTPCQYYSFDLFPLKEGENTPCPAPRGETSIDEDSLLAGWDTGSISDFQSIPDISPSLTPIRQPNFRQGSPLTLPEIDDFDELVDSSDFTPGPPGPCQQAYIVRMDKRQRSGSPPERETPEPPRKRQSLSVRKYDLRRLPGRESVTPQDGAGIATQEKQSVQDMCMPMGIDDQHEDETEVSNPRKTLFSPKR
ncbi:hypothetical protein AJ79_09447 [Helicocarpus griseus UAMH5409]|uniref:Uncharacterized protein n=1 Tax=Helicocarpus griseus UAMH5409 TaxID=1447875 RepID=A0A2B7WJJ9_9EURO|nr:hypothetical protein AJ79_09447 [Helicocarpus griseus UAMH5409]